MSQTMLDVDADEPRRQRTGPARAAVERSLKAWRADGHLEGPAFAAAARVLRDSADAVDAAHQALQPARCPSCRCPVPGSHVGSPGQLAYANNLHAQLVAAAQPAAGAGGDPYESGTDGDDALAAGIRAALAGPDAAAPGDAGAGD